MAGFVAAIHAQRHTPSVWLLDMIGHDRARQSAHVDAREHENAKSSCDVRAGVRNRVEGGR